MARRKSAKKDGGFDAKTIQNLRNAIRQVWQYSHARKVCIARATDKDGFGHCENPKCRKKVPKVYADHIEVMGDLLKPRYLQRMWCSSKHLQALCKKCHDKKTREERKKNEIARQGF